MADREMKQLEVFVNKGNTVSIRQEQFGEDDAIIAVHPFQIPLLIKWLREAKKEAEFK